MKRGFIVRQTTCPSCGKETTICIQSTNYCDHCGARI